MTTYVAESQTESLADRLLKWAVWRAAEAEGPIQRFDQAQQTARGDAKRAKGLDREERELETRKAAAALHDARVNLRASKEIKRAAEEELVKIQKEFFVEKLEIINPVEHDEVTVRAVLKKGVKIPRGYRLHWTVGDYKPVPESGQGLVVQIDTRQVPEGDVTIRAILEKGDEYHPQTS